MLVEFVELDNISRQINGNVCCEILNFKVGDILFLKSQSESRRRYEFIGIFVELFGHRAIYFDFWKVEN